MSFCTAALSSSPQSSPMPKVNTASQPAYSLTFFTLRISTFSASADCAIRLYMNSGVLANPTTTRRGWASHATTAPAAMRHAMEIAMIFFFFIFISTMKLCVLSFSVLVLAVD